MARARIGAPGGGGSAVSYPWVFNVQTYGAVGDGQVAIDGAITSGTNALACATSTPFTAADVGKAIQIKGAAATGVTTLVTTISGFTNSGHVTLTANAGASISGALVMWATDDTAAFRAAGDAAVDYALAGGCFAEVFIPASLKQFYGIAGPLITGGTTKGNAQWPFKVVPSTGKKITISIRGVGNGSAVEHWEQLVPTFSGSTLVSFGVFASTGAQTSSIDAGGNPCVIGGPSQPGGYGIAPGIFSNMLISIKDLSILTSYSRNGLTYTAGDLSGVANGHIENIAYGTTGSVPGNDYGAVNNFANGFSIGFLMPAAGNNDNCIVKNVTCHGGYTFAFFATEHAVIDTMRLLYCWSAFCPVGTYYSSVGATHAIKAQQLSIEACTNVVYIIGVGSAGVGPFVDIDQLDTESGVTYSDNTGGNGLAAALGTIKMTGLYNAASISAAHPTGLKIIDGQKPYPVVSKSANYSVSIIDDTILVNAAAGAVTITLISAVATPNTYTVQKTDATANAVILAAAGGQTINGAASISITTQWASKKAIPSGGQWYAV